MTEGHVNLQVDSVVAYRNRRAIELSRFIDQIRALCREHCFGLESESLIAVVDRKGPRHAKPIAYIGVDEYEVRA